MPDTTIYKEGSKGPLTIHDPTRFQDGERAEGLSSQIDVLPTVLDLLGYEVENGEYHGYSLLRESTEDRVLFSSCWFENKCLASVRGHKKYIHHYGNRPDEIFALSEDPSEQNYLAGEYSQEELDQRRDEILEWRSNFNVTYTPTGG